MEFDANGELIRNGERYKSVSGGNFCYLNSDISIEVIRKNLKQHSLKSKQLLEQVPKIEEDSDSDEIK